MRSQFLSIMFLSTLLFVSATVASAQVVPDSLFELDGNSVVNGSACTGPNTPTNCKDDWNLLNGTGTGNPTGSAGGSLARTFVSGAASVASFTTGGSKDPLDVTSWKWKNGTTPDKDAITNGYAAAYTAPNGHFILMFGADRFAVNGDANIGLWFFQQDVHPVGSSSGSFSGSHSLNDLFIVSAFTQGGGVATITAYTWDPGCTTGVKNPAAGDCADSNLRLKFASAPSGTCSGVLEGCAIVNGAPVDVSWPYLAKFGNNSTQIPAGGYYEGGIDVTQLLGGSLPCFSSFLIETRSSQTPSAVLKDFVFGNFNICGLSATKTCAGNGTVNSGGTTLHYTFNGTIKNTGIGTMYNVTIVDTLPTNSSNAAFTPASAKFGSILPGQTVNWSVEFDNTSTNVQNSMIAKGSVSSLTDPGTCTTSGTVCSASASDSCSANPTNSITVSKACGIPSGYPNNSSQDPIPGTQLVSSGGLAAVQVNFSGTIMNSGQTTLKNITLADNPTTSIVYPAGFTGTLAPGDSVKYSGSYLPAGTSIPQNNLLGGAAGRYAFNDEVKLTGATASLGSSPGADATCVSTFATGAQACAAATCNICPAGSSCAGN